jgi:phosphatidate cytidylyltransferase
LALVPVALGGPAVWYFAREQGMPAVSLAAGVAYIGTACVSLLWLRADAISGLANVLLLLLLVWASDIGAYLVGRLVGGPRLAPVISPGKTWSGAAGGLMAAALVGGLAALGLEQGGLFWRIVLFATGLGIVAQAGDLAESAIKRRFGVKDSGWLIPGHGGLFDRLDAVLAVAPVAAALALAMGRGVVLSQ